MANRVILIAGPTASGKSRLALAAAEHLRGDIINADSMQVYRDLAILTARPTKADMQHVPHRLYGVIDGSVAYSMADWVRDACAAISDSLACGRPAILVGGTGLYFKALCEGFAAIPDIDPGIRARIRRFVEEARPGEAHRALEAVDPGLAERLAPADRQRIARGLEVFEATGRALSHFQAEAAAAPLDAITSTGARSAFILDCPRDWLYARCNDRLAAMMGNGGLEELEALLRRGLPSTLPVMRALGVPQLRPHIEQGAAMSDCIHQAQMETRRFAKRQMTWMRNQFPDWHRIDAQRLEIDCDNFVRKL